VPENELSKTAGVELSPDTGGAVVDHLLQTSVPGIFACGNVLHVHDLVDFVSEEAQRCGAHVVDYLGGETGASVPTLPADAGANLKYVTPGRLVPGTESHFFMRSLVVRDKTELTVTRGTTVLFSKKLRHVRPAEMLSITIPAETTTGCTPGEPLRFSLR
jgi:hypothetical protein